jgi:hypothetical protein
LASPTASKARAELDENVSALELDLATEKEAHAVTRAKLLEQVRLVEADIGRSRDHDRDRDRDRAAHETALESASKREVGCRCLAPRTTFQTLLFHTLHF